MAAERSAPLAFALLAATLLSACGSDSPAPSPVPSPIKTGPLGDTWTWDGGNWARPAGPGPSPRFDTALAFDPAHGVTILFGGSGLLDQFDDTWSWDGHRWTKLQPAHHPITLSGHRMVYDEARHQVVLFGGAHGLYEKASNLTDTWTWDGSDWTLRASAGPPPIGAQSMAFDRRSGEVILFGGSVANVRYSDETWAWNGERWTLMPSTMAPSPRYYAALAFDPTLKSLLLFGGAVLKPNVGPGEAGVSQADSWSFLAGAWKELHPASSPGARANTVLAEDPTKMRLILFSGTACPYEGDTWSWDGTSWTRLHPAVSPQARAYAAMATDATRHRLVLFGGLSDTPCL